MRQLPTQSHCSKVITSRMGVSCSSLLTPDSIVAEALGEEGRKSVSVRFRVWKMRKQERNKESKEERIRSKTDDRDCPKQYGRFGVLESALSAGTMSSHRTIESPRRFWRAYFQSWSVWLHRASAVQVLCWDTTQIWLSSWKTGLLHISEICVHILFR